MGITSWSMVWATVLWWLVNGAMFLVFLFLALALLSSMIGTTVKDYYKARGEYVRTTTTHL